MANRNDTAILTIAGSDPSGGAGIQADLKTFAALNCYGASVITALTAQNTTGVQGVHPIPPEFIERQLVAVMEDLPLRAIKTGMLYDKDAIQSIVRTLKSQFAVQGKAIPLVCDPVCVSTSGHTLLQTSALGSLVQDLFPLSTIITPNKSEAEVLLNHSSSQREWKIEGLEDMLRASQELFNVVAASKDPLDQFGILLKGGHITTSLSDVNRVTMSNPNVEILKQNLPEENMDILIIDEQDYNRIPLVVDVLAQSSGQKTLFVRPRINSSNTHGTGCTLSSAIAAGLAKSLDLEQAVREATLYTNMAIYAASPNLGRGYGPLNHFHNLSSQVVPRASPTNKYPLTRLLIDSTKQSWKEYVEHEFVVQLGKGTLDKHKFIAFIKQDYLYLRYYAQAYALLAAKSTTFPQIAAANQVVLNVIQEIGNHKELYASFTNTPLAEAETELETSREEPATTAYGAFLLNMGLQGDFAKLTITLMACLLGYGEVGLWLKQNSISSPGCAAWVVKEDNVYYRWIEEYSNKEYQDAVKMGLQTIEDLARTDPPSEARFEEWRSVWERCTWLEKSFWDMAMRG
ncbi:Phosphomethylpyrimidine kinase-domain-containing protein [Crepidotus variabilis]|uniref:Phosphomethylpyrimidine kinase-domain-containing protein n=1 Tax=Crepidotus variabilis TaxID=179855 RepID=A0A9P6ERS6_9AGAR|nr:Phosphomethylpyrimidine kinase-domain-containing protein [Crepidotus variabilis]